MAPHPTTSHFLWCFLVLVVACVRAQSTNFTSTATSAASARSSSQSSSSASASASASASSFSSPSSSSSASFHSSSIIRSSASSSSFTFSSAPKSSSSSTSVTSTTTSSKSSSARSSVHTSFRPTSSHTTAVLIQTTPSATPSPTPEPVLTTTNEPSPSTSVNTDQRVAAASNGFWFNKGAVGGTFTVVALVIVGLLVAMVVLLRRRVARRKSARDTFFDTKNMFETPPSGRVSPGPSLISLGNQPMDAHSTPIPNYGTAFLVDTADYSITYPPGSSYPAEPERDTRQYYSTQPTAPISQQHHPTASDPQYTVEQDPYYADYYAANSGLDYQQPSSHPQATGASAAHGLPGRDSGYQQSIDSFYGAAGTAL
ncbi:hypothetical protein FB45DRAFT_904516 [Roridomyces roridus]|uniref:Transmembrane protein n=1 Tax=Roridomyces roridus TaxID=1738132 RepID=A0AAD7C4T8_9AGAR|nr:hypothetical protein FB45DRAFT_904516 [Roridomyces roridus]